MKARSAVLIVSFCGVVLLSWALSAQMPAAAQTPEPPAAETPLSEPSTSLPPVTPQTPPSGDWLPQGAVDASISVDGQAASITVSAASIWTDTGIDLSLGDQVSITAQGYWAPLVDYVYGPDGAGARLSADNFLNLADLGVCASCATTQTGHWAALIGYVGNAPPAPGSYTDTAIYSEATKVFLVGASFNSGSLPAGRLWLGFNDDAYSGNTMDNSGQVSAAVSRSVVVPTDRWLVEYYSGPRDRRGRASGNHQRLSGAGRQWRDAQGRFQGLVVDVGSGRRVPDVGPAGFRLIPAAPRC